jgi:UDP-GlcNAc:undecaprenyl-phosphate GlcNAc-1-phosphate transferase
VAIGLSERGAVAVLWLLAALGGMLAVAIRQGDHDWPGILAVLFLVAIAIFTVYLANVRMYRDVDDVPAAAGRVTPFAITFMYKRRVAEVFLDLGLVTLAYYAAYRLRFENPLSPYYVTFSDSLPMVVGVQMAALFAVGAYRGVWKYFGLLEGVVFAKAVFLGTITSVSLIVYVYRFESYSRGVFVIYAALLMLLLCGSRASFRLIREFAFRRRRSGRRVVIYGTGDTAASAVRDLLGSRGEGFRLLGFIDDDPSMAGARIQGYRVLGGYAKLQALISGGEVDGVVIAAPAIDVDRLEQLKTVSDAHGVLLSRLHGGLDRLEAAS